MRHSATEFPEKFDFQFGKIIEKTKNFVVIVLENGRHVRKTFLQPGGHGFLEKLNVGMEVELVLKKNLKQNGRQVEVDFIFENESEFEKIKNHRKDQKK